MSTPPYGHENYAPTQTSGSAPPWASFPPWPPPQQPPPYYPPEEPESFFRKYRVLFLVLGLVLGFGLAGVTVAFILASNASSAIAQTGPSAVPSISQGVTAPATTAPATTPAATPATTPAYDGTDPSAIVVNYYGDINAKDFPGAWAMGGSNVAAQHGQTYSSWVAGYARSGQIGVTTYNAGTDSEGNYIVHTDLSSRGVTTYAGTYTVSPSGTILGGQLTGQLEAGHGRRRHHRLRQSLPGARQHDFPAPCSAAAKAAAAGSGFAAGPVAWRARLLGLPGTAGPGPDRRTAELAAQP
jgi:hypothetical protein